ncbi:MAG: UvrB/UvrC motif-containing protein [Clostridia bacterium]|nr:hypothetical protein [Clostridiales bacterium]MBQ7918242.1 UvrB/UvrC motif-containing protein [Clostridia bacterium]
MFEFGEISNNFVNEEFNEKFCDKCNTSLSDVLGSGVVGCSNCYSAFQNEIRSYLLNKQGNFNHVGKLALKRTSKLKLEEEIKQLEVQKQKAVEEENFIVAESLKNQIEKLRGRV